MRDETGLDPFLPCSVDLCEQAAANHEADLAYLLEDWQVNFAVYLGLDTF